nr:CbiQ family ECF transporter T component [Nigerium massiliense]
MGVATAASLTTNPLLLALLTLGVVAVVLLRRTDAPWARSLGVYFALAGFILAIRLFFQVIMGAGIGQTVLFRLPELHLPAWAAGIRLGGAVTAEALAYSLYDALRLVVMLVCLGAANALANPRRALRSVPAALYDASVAVVIALSVAPQLIESTQRIRRARRLRGGARTGWTAVVAVVIPVIADAVDRSLALAAGMEARGFGRTKRDGPPPRSLTAALVGGMMLLVLGAFLLLNSADVVATAVACLAVGAVAVGLGLRAAGRRQGVTRYRPDPWTARDTGIVASGFAAAAVVIVVTQLNFAAVHPSTDPLSWPALHPGFLAALAACLAPLMLAPAPQPVAEGVPA